MDIKGSRPLLWHKFGLSAISPQTRERTGVVGNDPEEWKRTVLATEQRQLYLEPGYIFAAIRDGAKYTARKRGTLQPLVVATLQVLDDRILIDRFLPDPETSLSTNPNSPVYLDIRGVRNPATKGRNVRYRVAASPGWGVSFTILWDKTLVSRGEMEAVIIDAGRLSVSAMVEQLALDASRLNHVMSKMHLKSNELFPPEGGVYESYTAWRGEGRRGLVRHGTAWHGTAKHGLWHQNEL